MKKYLKERKRAFTLIELLVVVATIGILASVVLASLTSARDSARIAAGKQFEANIYHYAGDQAVGQWDFNECTGGAGTTTFDQTGLGNNGTLSTPPPTWSADTPSGSGCSLSFNGTSQYVDMGNFSAQVVSNFTIMAWVKSTAVTAGFESIVTNSTTGQTRFPISLSIMTTGKVRLTFKDETGVTQFVLDDNRSIMGDGVWHYLAAAYDGTTVRLYRDGTLAVSGNPSAAPGTTHGNFTVGKFGSDNSAYFLGLIDDVRLFSKSFTASEVQKLYAEQLRTLNLVEK